MEPSPDLYARLQILVALASEFRQKGQFEEELDILDELISLVRELDVPAALALCLMDRASCLHSLGRYEEALTACDEALPLFHHHDRPADLARCLLLRANCLVDLGRYEEALTGYNSALPLFRDYGLPATPAGCLMSRAECLLTLGRTEDALTDLDEALPFFRKHGPPAILAHCLMDRASCLDSLGRYEEALTAFDEALPRFRDHGRSADIAGCLMNRASSLGNLGRYEDALTGYNEALPLFRDHGRPADIARCLMNRANCLQRLGRHEDALTGFDEALPRFRDHGHPADIALCLMNRASCLHNLGRHEGALTTYDKALPLFRDHGLPADIALCLRNRANCLQDLGRYKDALTEFETAFVTEDRASVLLQDPLNRSRARQETVIAYRIAARLALHLHQPDRAWTIAQRAKGRTLTDLLQVRGELTALDRQEFLLTQQHESGQLDHDAFALAIRHIGDQREVQQQARLGIDPRAPMDLAEVVAALQPGEVLLDAFTVQDDGSLVLFLLRPDQPTVTWTHPIDGARLASLVERWTAARTTWTTTMTARAKLDDDYPGDNPSIVVRRERLRTHYTATIAAAGQDETAVLAELGALLLAPVLAQLDQSVTTLIVSPDGLLHQLPLAAITVPDAAGQPIPLIERLDLQLIPSATSLAILRGPHGPRLTWPPALLAAAPFATKPAAAETNEPTTAPEPPDHDEPPVDLSDLNDRAFALGASRTLIRAGDDRHELPESGPEIQAVADLLTSVGSPATRLPRTEATRARLEAALPAARILHLATHGGLLDTNAGESVMDYRIFLADDTEVQVRELYDGVISLQDVFLVTLSACSLGQVMQQGAEALGFVQAFLQAGAGVVLAPLWDVYDAPTRLLMERFYTELTAPDHPTMATAWRRAACWLRTETDYDHPVFWAGFLPSGDAAIHLTPPA